MVAVHYTARSDNEKTGNTLLQWIGATAEETRHTCFGCPLLKHQKVEDSPSVRIQKFGLACHAHFGRIAVAQRQIWEGVKRGKDYSLKYALDHMPYGAKFTRYAIIGDPSGLDDEQLQRDEYLTRKTYKKGIVGFTHFGRKGQKGEHLKGRYLASADNWDEAEELVAAGWRVALHTKHVGDATGTFRGMRFAQCLHDLGKAQCVNCGMCDATKAPKVNVVKLVEH